MQRRLIIIGVFLLVLAVLAFVVINLTKEKAEEEVKIELPEEELEQDG